MLGHHGLSLEGTYIAADARLDRRLMRKLQVVMIVPTAQSQG